MKIFLGVLVIIGVCVLTVCGCGSPEEREFSPVVPSENEIAKITYEKVNLKKVINPEFVEEYYGKYIEFTATFSQQINKSKNLPKKYHEGYVQVMVSPGSSLLSGVHFNFCHTAPALHRRKG